MYIERKKCIVKKTAPIRHCLSFLAAGSSNGSDGARLVPGAGDANRGERRRDWVASGGE